MPLPRRLDPEHVVAHLPRLYRAARAWTGSRDEAEDLVQEVCARVLAHTRLITGEDEAGYLLRAMHNTLVSQRRSAARRPVAAELDGELPDERPGRDDPVATSESDEVFALVFTLPEALRDALVAVDVAGLSYQEAAVALGVPIGTVTSRLYRARERLARLLDGASS